MTIKISAAFNQNQMGIYNATSALLNQLPNQQQPAHHQLQQQQGKQQNGDFENFPTREDYRNGFTFDSSVPSLVGNNLSESFPVQTEIEPVITGFHPRQLFIV